MSRTTAWLGDARERTFVQPLSHVDRCILDGDTVGFVKVHVKPGTDRILGATVDDLTGRGIPGLRLEHGVVVLAHGQESGPATGLQTGDVIHEVNGAAVTNLEFLQSNEGIDEEAHPEWKEPVAWVQALRRESDARIPHEIEHASAAD